MVNPSGIFKTTISNLNEICVKHEEYKVIIFNNNKFWLLYDIIHFDLIKSKIGIINFNYKSKIKRIFFIIIITNFPRHIWELRFFIKINFKNPNSPRHIWGILVNNNNKE